MPTISIVTSTFNRSGKLKRAIESVQKQTFQDWEMIIVDDHSTDDTEKMVKDMASKDPRIVYIRLGANFGTDTRPKNTGIMMSKGEYVCFLDDDNVYRPHHLQVLLKAIEEEPQFDGVYGDRFIYINDEPKGLGVQSDFDPTLLFGRNYIDTSDILLKRDTLFDLGGFDESYRKFVDWNLWLRAVKLGKRFKRVPMILTDYYISQDSKSNRVEDTRNNLPAWDPVDCPVVLDYLGKKEPIKVAIFSITYDRLDYTKECFEQMYKTAGYNFDHFIIDNGSQDGTPEYLESLENPNGNVIVYCNTKNTGISHASNQALDIIKSYGKYDAIMKVDNDCFFKNNGWLKTMIDVHRVFPRFALSCFVDGLRDNPGGAPRADYITINNELVGVTKHLGGICHFVSSRAYDNFRWDEESFLHGVQDMEFSMFLDYNGFYQGYLESWFCEHKDGTEGQHKKYKDYFERRKLEKRTKYEENR